MSIFNHLRDLEQPGTTETLSRLPLMAKGYAGEEVMLLSQKK